MRIWGNGGILRCKQAIWQGVAFGLILSVSAWNAHGQAPASHHSKPKKHAASQAKPQSDLVETPKIPGMRFVHIVPYGTPKKLTTPPTSSAGGLFSYFGGPVISNVHVVEVLWGAFVDVPSTTGLPQFLTDVTNSNYFDLLSEYGTVGVPGQGGSAGSNQLIGRGVFDGKFTITPSICPGSASNPPICNLTDAQIQSELQKQLIHLPAPVKDGQSNYNTIYLLYFPPGVHISVGVATSCGGFFGFCAYHSSLFGSLPSEIPYGVFPDFGPTSGCSQGCGRNTSANNMTSTTSHELGEAVTDANVGNAGGGAPPLAWYNGNAGEIGDNCNQDQRQISVGGNTYIVQALYSNMQDACVIAPAQMALLGRTGVIPGRAFNLTATVSPSPGGRLTFGYSNTVHFTSSDAQAVLPATIPSTPISTSTITPARARTPSRLPLNPSTARRSP